MAPNVKYKTAVERQAARRRSRTAVRQRAKEEGERLGPAPSCGHNGAPAAGWPEPPPEVIEEAQRAYAALGRRSIVSELQGDPLPGRSALDRMGRLP
jgi:hypothetical protein